MKQQLVTPTISFKDYCQQFQKTNIKTPQCKPAFVLGDLPLNKLHHKQKDDFKKFVYSHISETRKVRNHAEFDASMYMGLTSKWKRNKKEYFEQPFQQFQYELDMRIIQKHIEPNFQTWKKVDSISQRKCRSSSQSFRYTKPKSNSFRF